MMNKHNMQKACEKSPFEAIRHRLALEYHKTIQLHFGEQCELYVRFRDYVRRNRFTSREFFRIAESLNSTYNFTGSHILAWGILLERPDQIEGIGSIAILPKRVTSAITREFKRTANLDAYSEAVRAACSEYGLPEKFIRKNAKLP